MAPCYCMLAPLLPFCLSLLKQQLSYVSADGTDHPAQDSLWRGGAQMAGPPNSPPHLNSLCPGDLLSLTRCPLFLIVDGTCFDVFSPVCLCAFIV